MSADLEELLKAVGIQNETIKKDSATVQDILTQQKQDQAQLVVDTANAGNAQGETAITKQAEELAALKSQQQAIKFNTSLGTNLDDSSEILTSLASQLKDAEVDSINKAKVVQDNINTNFVDDPVKWIKNQFLLEGQVKEADAAAAVEGRINTALGHLQAQTQSINATVNASAEVRTDATVQSKVQAVQSQIDASVDKIKINNAASNVQGILGLEQMQGEQIKYLSTAIGAKQQQEQLNLSKARFALEQKSMELLIQDRAEKLEKNKLNAAELEDTVQMVKEGAAALGYKDIGSIPSSKVVQFLNMKAENYQEFLRVGLQSRSTGRQVLSDDAGKSAALIAKTNAPLSVTQKDIKTFFQNIWSTASGEVTAGGLKGQEALDHATARSRQLANETADKYLKNIEIGGLSNIYSPPSLQTLIQQPAIAKLDLTKTVLSEQKGLIEFNSKQLIELTNTAVKDKKISYNKAVSDLAILFATVPAYNNTYKNYAGLGLPIQQGYKTALPNRIGVLNNYDLATEKDVGRVMTNTLLGQLPGTSNPFGIYN